MSRRQKDNAHNRVRKGAILDPREARATKECAGPESRKRNVARGAVRRAAYKEKNGRMTVKKANKGGNQADKGAQRRIIYEEAPDRDVADVRVL